MDQNKFTRAFTELVETAYTKAIEQSHATLLPLDIVAACLSYDYPMSCFTAMGVDTAELSRRVEHELAALPQVSGAQVTVDSKL